MTSSLSPPVLILASRGARGSLLSALLGGHPDLYGAQHLNVLAFETAYQHQKYSVVPRDSGLHGLLRFLAQELVGEQSLQAVQAARRWLGHRVEHTAVEIYTEIRSLIRPRRLVDYSPLCALTPQALRRTVEAVPNAALIHLVAGPEHQARTLGPGVWQSINASMGYWKDRGLNHASMDVFEIGDHLIDWSSTPAVFDTQFCWYRTQNAIASLSEELPFEQLIRVHTEDLLSDPADTLAQVLSFLNLECSTDMIDAICANTEKLYTDVGPFDAASGVDYDMIGHSPASALEAADSAEKIITPNKPLAWRGDEEVLQPELIELATRLGYTVAK